MKREKKKETLFAHVNRSFISSYIVIFRGVVFTPAPTFCVLPDFIELPAFNRKIILQKTTKFLVF